MTRSEFLFKAVDIIFDPFQNYRRYRNVERRENFVYDQDFPEECVGEIYLDPSLEGRDRAPLPVVLNIHGGGFVKGDMRHRRSLSAMFADRGYFVMNVNYRLAPAHPFPAAVRDCVKALNHAAVLAERYNIDTGRVCVTGDSAGAYYAAEVAAMAADPEMREKLGAPEFRVRPAVLAAVCGPYDFESIIRDVKIPFNFMWDVARCLFDGPSFRIEKDFSNLADLPLLEYTGPLGRVNGDWCPTFLVMSTRDMFCKGQGELLKKRLDEAGVDNECFVSSKASDNHDFPLSFWTKSSRECFDRMFAFMDARLKPAEK